MANKLKENMEARNELLTKAIRTLEEKIMKMPDGTIKIKKTKNKVYYYQHLDSDKYLASEDRKLIEQLIQKNYLQSVLKAAKKEADALNKSLAGYPEEVIEDVYDNLSDERKKYAIPIVPGDAEYAAKWLAMPYSKKLISIDTEFYTLKGEHVRSKSEVIIADRLYSKGIPYKYECPLYIGNKVIYPDFTILRLSDRKILYHEHCGMMDNPDYSKDVVGRVNLYSTAGVCLGDRLFLTFETSESPLDIKLLDELIEKHFR